MNIEIYQIPNAFPNDCCEQAATLIENWPIQVNECNGDLSTTNLGVSFLRERVNCGITRI
jgi:hypothetical protein